MNSLKTKQILRFQEVFPELPVEVAEVVMLYAAGARQVDIIGAEVNLTRRQVDWTLNKAAQILELHSIPAIRTVVLTRLLLEQF
ncbi:hypothetical protein ACE1BS_24170 [Aeromonas jandaei]